ncbi:MAG: acyl-CoA dehydrogenase family protein [Actinomycetota bacterium]|nr:acyl-CoA dehydrogenase family protein [Actinomycetota bacterium]
MSLTPPEVAARDGFRAFARDEVAPRASASDAAGAIAEPLVVRLAESGYLGATVSTEFGGAGMDDASYGLLCEEVGAACSSTRSLVTVQNMVARAIARWGTDEQRAAWLPRLASGDAIAAFCLTEPETGSDAGAVRTTVEDEGDDVVLSGRKLWVTFGMRADVFLVIGRGGAGATAVLVEARAPGLTRRAVSGQLGLRAAMLAEIDLDGCRAPRTEVLGWPGFGFSHVASTALDHGRFSVAWGCVGIGRACLEASVAYASTRRQFGAELRDHQLIRRMISDMAVDVDAARLMCVAAARARSAGGAAAIPATMAAKYFAARMLPRVTNDAVQIHGANGIGGAYPVERHFRDAKVMQIIEGTDQMHQLNLAEFALRDHDPAHTGA